MSYKYYPLTSFFVAVILAQGIKPFFMYIKDKKVDFHYILASGGYPSSHSSGVVALALAIGLKDGFDSSLFALAIASACIVLYDANNVRYYAGKNIQVTKEIIKDLNLFKTNPIFSQKIKDVLGHTKFEIFVGALLGIAVAIVLFFCWR